jgi:hypothetical protein
MNKLNITVFAAAIGLALAAAALAGSLSPTDYQSARKAIEADYKSLKAGCDPLSANARDICNAEAKGKENVALAELKASYKPGSKTRYGVRIAKANAAHSIAREKCDDLADDAKDVCVKEADAARVAAKADARAQMKTTDANRSTR